MKRIQLVTTVYVKGSRAPADDHAAGDQRRRPDKLFSRRRKQVGDRQSDPRKGLETLSISSRSGQPSNWQAYLVCHGRCRSGNRGCLGLQKLLFEFTSRHAGLADDRLQGADTHFTMIRHWNCNRSQGNFFLHDHVLPRLRTSSKPDFLKMAQTSLPERMRNLANRDLDLGHEDFTSEPLLDFIRGRRR